MGTFPNNPPGRLLAILQAVRTAQSDRSTYSVWARFFEIPEENTSQILLNLADVIKLAKEARQIVAATDGIDHQLYLRPFDNIIQAVSQKNLDGPWASIANLLDPTTMVALEFCADTLSRRSQEAPLTAEKMEEVQSEIDNLINEISNSDLPPDLKDFLLDNLEELRRGLLAYRYYGSEGLRNEIQRILGASMFAGDMLKPYLTRKEVTEFFDLLKTIMTVISFANASGNVLGKIVPFLLNSGTK